MNQIPSHPEKPMAGLHVLVVEDSLVQRAHAVSLVEQLGERQMSVARRMTQLAHDLVYPCVVG